MPVCPINITLNTGAKMPALGLGTWQANDDKELEDALEAALEIGYRHIDAALAYANEHVIGKILKKWIDSGKVKREELFITTKLPPSGNRQSSVEKYIKKSLQDLQLDYVDLYLIHMPMGCQDGGDAFAVGADGKVQLDMNTDLVGTWRGLEAQVDAGRAKAIGVSNFNEKQLQRILDAARIKPANLQIELNVYFQQRPLVDFCHKNNISVVGFASLGSRGAAATMKSVFGVDFNLPDLLSNETVLQIAKKHNKQANHVLLRHVLQRGIATIPKSTNAQRLLSNFSVFDFELDKDDMEALNKLDQGAKGRSFDLSKIGFAGHPELPY